MSITPEEIVAAFKSSLSDEALKQADAEVTRAIVGYHELSDSVYIADPACPPDRIYVFPARYSQGVQFSGTLDGGLFKPTHPWLGRNGMADYIRIMRGEQELPHLPIDCDECYKLSSEQEKILQAHGLLPSRHRKRNPGRRKLLARQEQVRAGLRILAQCGGKEEAAA